ncbi:c-type cytochrome [Kaarinaea lacus]
MRNNYFDLIIFATVVLAIGLITGCGSDQQTSAPPAATATPIAPQQAPETPSETTASSGNTIEQQVVTESMEQSDEATPSATASDTQPTSTTTATANDSTQADALALARKSGCLACHAVDKKVVGPAWKDVAKRYANNAGARAQLIEKVSKGGKGNWTDVVGTAAMPPYYPRVSKENIEALVDFVLSLANT